MHYAVRMITNNKSPFGSPIWQGLGREADLSTQLICSGANEIGRASFYQQGHYAAAQFGFSNGLERLGKLILTSDSLLATGAPLSDNELRKTGHSIAAILNEVENISKQRALQLTYERPTGPISTAIISCLDDFAAASRGRYANHASLTGTPSPHDPVVAWWSKVCKLILKAHFAGTPSEVVARKEAAAMQAIMNAHSATLFFHEDGSVVQDLEEVTVMTHERAVTQRWGRFYTLSHARWLADIFDSMTGTAQPAGGVNYFFGHYERVQTLRVADAVLRTRKSWPLA